MGWCRKKIFFIWTTNPIEQDSNFLGLLDLRVFVSNYPLVDQFPAQAIFLQSPLIVSFPNDDDQPRLIADPLRSGLM